MAYQNVFALNCLQNNIVVKEIDLLKSNVSTNDVYILDQGLTIYLVSSVSMDCVTAGDCRCVTVCDCV